MGDTRSRDDGELHGVDHELVASVVLDAPAAGAESPAVTVSVETKLPSLEVQTLVQVLDPQGHEVIDATLSEVVDIEVPLDAPMLAAELTLPDLPEGYYAIQATVLANVTAVGAGSGGEHSRSDRLYVYATAGELVEVSYATWFFDAGAGSVTSPTEAAPTPTAGTTP